MQLKLRNYQEEFYDNIKKGFGAGHKRILGVLPCG